MPNLCFPTENPEFYFISLDGDLNSNLDISMYFQSSGVEWGSIYIYIPIMYENKLTLLMSICTLAHGRNYQPRK